LATELVPEAEVIGLLINPTNPGNETIVNDWQEAARAKRIRFGILTASSANEIATAFASLPQLKAGALLVSPDALFFTHRKRVVALASQAGVPTIYGWRQFVEDGGLIAYAPSAAATYRRAAIYVAKILNGAKPADLPVEQPTKFELVINLKTAKALGLTVPQSLLARADEVIE